MENDKLIRERYDFCNKYIDMKTLPKEFQLGVSIMADTLLKDIAQLSLVRTKEHAEWIIEKHKIAKLSCELEEAVSYWKKKNNIQ